nr:helix-turn-helix transcriptional regulator [Streptomyces sp. SID5785]
MLRGLKDRSGLSYGTLAKRLHLSTSTLHRYCNGTAVPTDYAPVERLARVCRATPEELVELHRRWILADAHRGSANRRAAAPGATPGPVAAAAPDVTPDAPDVTPVAGGGTPAPRTPRPRRRTALIAAVAVAAVLGATVLAVDLFAGDGQDASGRHRAAGARQPTAASASASVSGSPSPSAGAKDRDQGKDPAAGGRSGAPESRSPGTGGTGGTGGGAPATGTPFTVGTRPYVYDQPCSQHFLVDSDPDHVGPPADEQGAPGWASAYGAVSGGEQRVALTLQGTGPDTVVLEALHVTVAGKSAPLAWNDYAMGSGCGGGVETRSFDVPLDAGSPTVSGINGQRDFPYKVSESDPEVFYITAHTEAHDVRWYLTLDWSSGSRHGTVRIDNDGTPFRTSANEGRPGYHYPLGGSEWIARDPG